MGSYVKIIKKYEDDERVLYNYGPNAECMGTLQIMKADMEYSEVEPVPNGRGGSRFCYLKAVSKIIRTAKEDPENPFPDDMFSAS